jgi:hypothetical protein
MYVIFAKRILTLYLTYNLYSVTSNPHSHAHPHSHDAATSDPEKHAAERLQHVVEFLEAHFGDVEFVDLNQQHLEDSHVDESENKTNPDAKDTNSREHNLDVEDGKDAQEDDDAKMDEADEDEDDKGRRNQAYQDTPIGPYLLVKLDNFKARIAVPAMVRPSTFPCHLY